MQQRSSIHPAVLQQLLESAPNAAAKGQAQYFTPPDWSQILTIPLPKWRPAIVDLQAGNGQLLAGAAHRGSKLLAADIDQSLAAPKLPSEGGSSNFIPADTTLLYPLLKAVHFEADLFVLNPPWDLHWRRDRLAALSESELPAVQLAFSGSGSGSRITHHASWIDSTIATFCLALDLMSTYGEGLLIANASTIERLIFAPGAPHSSLAAHAWAHLIIEGNICNSSACRAEAPSEGGSSLTLPRSHAPTLPRSTFRTSVLYFARSHTSGPAFSLPVSGRDHAEGICRQLAAQRLTLRQGPEIKRDYAYAESTPARWSAVAEEWRRLHPSDLHTKSAQLFNLFLNPDGAIATALSLYDQAAARFTKAEAAALFELTGKHPMQLVLQRASRKALERATGSAGVSPASSFRVAPALIEAVQNAITQYNQVRSPLYPLSKVQRLGYLDEQDEIECCKDLMVGTESSPSPIFHAGHRYPIRSATVRVRRSGVKRNLEGGLDDVAYNGQELAFFISSAPVGTESPRSPSHEFAFMESRLRDPSVKVGRAKPHADLSAVRLGLDEAFDPCPIEFTLQQLIEHFVIPDVPDVATLRPEEYARNLQLLGQIESLC